MTDDGSNDNGSTTQVLDIPIVAYPPFQLRSSLIDKDPVIWVHLLEYYIVLFQKLITIYTTARKGGNKTKLSLKSQQQLGVFLKIYFREVSEESTKVFSLGAINPDIVKNSKLLKLYVFELVKLTNLVNLGLSPETVWDFVKVYCKLANLNDNGGVNNKFPVKIWVIRKLITGSIKSTINSKSDDISLIPVLQKHLKNLIELKKFDMNDLEVLSLLLGQNIHHRIKGNNNNKNHKQIKAKNQNQNASQGQGNNNNKNNTEFASKFVNANWIETLEVLHTTKTHAKVAFEICIISVLSLSIRDLSKLISMDLQVKNFNTMVRLFPLLGSIVLSENYNKMNPGLQERLPFLSKEGRKVLQKQVVVFDQVGIDTIIDLFPQLEITQIKKLLIDNGHNVEQVTDILLQMEDPNQYTELGHYQESTFDEINRKQQLDPSSVHFGKQKRTINHKTATSKDKNEEKDLKQATLNAALRLLYESDEDEPDDTYDDQEVTSVTDDTTDSSRRGGGVGGTTATKLEQVENTLFQIYKKRPELFEKPARKGKERNEMKKQTSWTDEQIEGWARMLLRQPAKFKMLDEAYNFGNFSTNNRQLKTSTKYRKESSADVTDDDTDDEKAQQQAVIDERKNFKRSNKKSVVTETSTNNTTQAGPGPGATGSGVTSAKSRNYDTKKKASRANHNRKSGHDKKMSKGFG